MLDVSFRSIKYARHRPSDLLITSAQTCKHLWFSLSFDHRTHDTHIHRHRHRHKHKHIGRQRYKQIERSKSDYDFSSIYIWFGSYSAIIVGTLNASKVCHSGLSLVQNTFYETIWWKCQHQHQHTNTYSEHLLARSDAEKREKCIVWWSKIYVLICSHSIKWNSAFTLHIYRYTHGHNPFE